MTEEPTPEVTAPNDFDRLAIPVDSSDSTTANPPAASARPFGPWASIALTIVLLVVLATVQGVIMVGLEASRKVPSASDGAQNRPLMDGFVISVATLASSVVLVAVVALLARARRYPLREYLALRLPTARQAGLAICGLIVLMVASDSTSYLLGRPLVPQVMVDIYRTSPLFLLILAVVLAGAASEEVVFRGFLYEGIAQSRWGPVVAVLVSAVFWAAPHLQYDAYGVVTIALFGLYLGGVRFKTRSLPMTLLLHGLSNAISLAETASIAHGAN